MPYCICCEQDRVNVVRLTMRAQSGMNGGILLEIQKCLVQYVLYQTGKQLEMEVHWDVPWDVCSYCYHDSSAHRIANWHNFRCL